MYVPINKLLKNNTIAILVKIFYVRTGTLLFKYEHLYCIISGHNVFTINKQGFSFPHNSLNSSTGTKPQAL